MVSKDEFKTFLTNLVSAEEKEKYNKKIVRNTIISICLLLAAIFFAFLMLVVPGGNASVFITLSIMSAVGSLIVILSRRIGVSRDLEKKYKNKVLDFIFKDTKYSYSKHDYISKRIFTKSQLARDYEDLEGEDLLVLNIPDDNNNETSTNLIISDVHATKEVYNNDKDRYETKTLYKGVLGYVEFPFKFNCRLTINRNEYAYMENLSKVELESIDFNKKFKVRSSDQIEARYILTTDMMAKLMAIHEREKNFELVLDENMMFISMPWRNMFSVKVGKTVDGEAFLGFYEDIALFMDIIKEIQTNDKIFKM